MKLSQLEFSTINCISSIILLALFGGFSLYPLWVFIGPILAILLAIITSEVIPESLGLEGRIFLKDIPVYTLIFLGVATNNLGMSLSLTFPVVIQFLFRDFPELLRNKYSKLQKLLDAMNQAAQRLSTSDGSAVYKNNYLAAARAYYAMRQDGLLTIYDEQRISNDLQSLLPSPSLNVKGDYIDNKMIVNNSVRVDRLDEDMNSPDSIKRSCLTVICRNSSRGASLLNIIEYVRAPKEQIINALELLQLENLIEVGNRDDGVVVYKPNELG